MKVTRTSDPAMTLPITIQLAQFPRHTKKPAEHCILGKNHLGKAKKNKKKGKTKTPNPLTIQATQLKAASMGPQSSHTKNMQTIPHQDNYSRRTNKIYAPD